MLRRHTGDNARITQVRAPQLLQCLNFVGHLAQAFVDALGLAAGTGGTQAQPAQVQIQFGRRQGLGVQGLQCVALSYPQVDLAVPAQPGLRLQVGGQQHADPGPPRTQQGHGQFGSVFQVYGDVLHAALAQATRQAQGLFTQRGVVQLRVNRDPAIRVPLEQQLLKFYPIHARPLTFCRISHSMANSSPISA